MQMETLRFPKWHEFLIPLPTSPGYPKDVKTVDIARFPAPKTGKTFSSSCAKFAQKYTKAKSVKKKREKLSLFSVFYLNFKYFIRVFSFFRRIVRKLNRDRIFFSNVKSSEYFTRIYVSETRNMRIGKENAENVADGSLKNIPKILQSLQSSGKT